MIEVLAVLWAVYATLIIISLFVRAVREDPPDRRRDDSVRVTQAKRMASVVLR